MNKLNKTIEILERTNLIKDYADFSKNYAERNDGWLSYTLHKEKDFTLSTSINVLRNVRCLREQCTAKHDDYDPVVSHNIEALNEVDQLLGQHLKNAYGITIIE